MMCPMCNGKATKNGRSVNAAGAKVLQNYRCVDCTHRFQVEVRERVEHSRPVQGRSFFPRPPGLVCGRCGNTTYINKAGSQILSGEVRAKWRCMSCGHTFY